MATMTIDIFSIVQILLIIVGSMVIHEITHAYVSYWLGDNTAKLNNRLSFNPIKHIDPFMSVLLPLTLALTGAPIFGGAKPVPYNPLNIKWGDWGVALVAASGPLSNLIIAFMGYLFLTFLQPVSSEWYTQALTMIVLVNLGFFIFNLLPLPPLDGSRVLYALAPEFIRRLMIAIEPYGIFILLIIVIFLQSWLFNLFASSENTILNLFKIITLNN